MVRDEGSRLNTHYRGFQAPMGLALADGGSRLAVGTTTQVWEFRDVPNVAPRLEPAGRHDACFLPRRTHHTGNVQIQEMEFDSLGQLWFVNTRFSCRRPSRVSQHEWDSGDCCHPAASTAGRCRKMGGASFSPHDHTICAGPARATCSTLVLT